MSAATKPRCRRAAGFYSGVNKSKNHETAPTKFAYGGKQRGSQTCVSLLVMAVTLPKALPALVVVAAGYAQLRFLAFIWINGIITTLRHLETS